MNLIYTLALFMSVPTSGQGIRGTLEENDLKDVAAPAQRWAAQRLQEGRVKPRRSLQAIDNPSSKEDPGSGDSDDDKEMSDNSIDNTFLGESSSGSEDSVDSESQSSIEDLDGETWEIDISSSVDDLESAGSDDDKRLDLEHPINPTDDTVLGESPSGSEDSVDDNSSDDELWYFSAKYGYKELANNYGLTDELAGDMDDEQDAASGDDDSINDLIDSIEDEVYYRMADSYNKISDDIEDVLIKLNSDLKLEDKKDELAYARIALMDTIETIRYYGEEDDSSDDEQDAVIGDEDEEQRMGGDDLSSGDEAAVENDESDSIDDLLGDVEDEVYDTIADAYNELSDEIEGVLIKLNSDLKLEENEDELDYARIALMDTIETERYFAEDYDYSEGE